MTTYDQQGNMQNMPTSYDAPAYQAGGAAPAETIIDKQYMTGLKGILKALELGLGVIVIICSSVWESQIKSGGGWAQFVSTTALIITAILYVLYIFRVTERIREALGIYNLVEFALYAGIELCYFITAIIAAVYGGYHASVGAAAFFCFAILIPYGVDAFFAFQTWRSAPAPQAAMPAQQAPGQMDPISSVERGPQY